MVDKYKEKESMSLASKNFKFSRENEAEPKAIQRYKKGEPFIFTQRDCFHKKMANELDSADVQTLRNIPSRENHLCKGISTQFVSHLCAFMNNN